MLKVALDAGHGYDTPGKRTPDGSMKEYEFNRATAYKVKEILENEYEGVETLITFRDSHDVPLRQRTDWANDWKADVFVSIHANAAGRGWSSAEGIETFVYKTRPKEAVQLAAHVQNHLIRETGRKNRGVKAADFHVLRETKMTAILCECGFMTNKEEASLLKSDSYRKKCAEAIVKGLVEHYKLKKKAASKPAPAKPAASNQKEVYRVQVGAFADRKNAERLVAELKKKGYPAFITK
jgi:N-acetylmuramoyl-L-alanine amidase